MTLLPLPFTAAIAMPRADAGVGAEPAPGALHSALVGLGVFLYSGARLPLGGPADELGSVDPINTVMQLVILLGSAMATLYHWRRCLRLLRVAWPFLVLIGFLALSALWSDQPQGSLRRSVSMLTVFLFTLSSYAAFGMRHFMKHVLVMLMLIAAAGIVTAVVNPRIGLGEGEYANAIRGLYDQKNALGFSMTIAALCAAYLAVARASLRVTDAVLLLAILVMTILARSTTAMLLCALVGGMAVICVGLERGGAWAASAVAAVGLGLFAVVVTFALVDLEAVFELLGKDSSLTGRTFIWDASWRAISERPWLGYGYSAFWSLGSPKVQLIWIAIGWETPNAHSGFLEILLQLGWIGAGLFMLLALGTFLMAVLAIFTGQRGAGLWVILILAIMAILGRTESVLLNPDIFMIIWISALLAVRDGTSRPVAPTPVMPPWGGWRLGPAGP